MATALTQILSTILGIVITITLILVQMTANRYLPQIIDLFIRWKVNLIPLSIFIFSLIYINISQHVYFNALLFFLCLGLLVPYFYLLFNFLKPVNIINSMIKDAIEAMNRGRRAVFNDRIMNISRMAKSAVQYMVSEIPVASINGEREILIRHMMLKEKLPAKWFEVSESDFPGMPPQAIVDIKNNRTWLEMQVFHTFMPIFVLVLNSWYKLRDVITSMLISVRIVGEKAQEIGDRPALDLTLKFFNTFCRLALNSNDRTIAYNILYQYRLLAEAILDKNEEMSLKIAFFIKYYGETAEDMGIPYVLETSIYDLMMLNCTAFDRKSGIKSALLDEFLSVGRLCKQKGNERTLRDFRKRCLMMGGFYLLRGDNESAVRIAGILKEVPGDVIKEIERELLGISDQEFWEVTDRIINFDYADAGQKEKIREFVNRLTS